MAEFADGGTLEALLTERRRQNLFFSNDDLRNLYTQLCLGIKAINEVLVHRDIKPDNILFSKNILKIGDFGLSKVVSEATRNYTFKGINHILYCAPEAWRTEANTPAMDMYSMGIVFYEIATLNRPYHIEDRGDIVDAWKNAHLMQLPIDPKSFNPALPIEVVQAILKMLSKRPEERYNSWDDIISRLHFHDQLSNSNPRINQLVEKALDSHRKAEEARLLAEKESKRKEENAYTVSYCFEKDIVNSIEDLIKNFNENSDVAKLDIHRGTSRFNFFVHLRGNTSKGIEISVVHLDNHYELHKNEIKIVKAWGYVRSPSGKGFNLLLVASNKDEIYGSWLSLHVGHSGFSRNTDNRPEPFPFELSELPIELQNINAMHIYTYRTNKFEISMLDEFLEELL